MKNGKWIFDPKPIKKDKPKKKGIRNVSPKQKEKNKTYSALRVEFLAQNTVCKITGEPAIEVHHTYSGKDRAKHFLDVETWLAVSRNGHNKIHNNPKWARDNGYLK